MCTWTNCFARCELFAKQGRCQDPCTLALRASQSFVYRELTERVIIVIVSHCEEAKFFFMASDSAIVRKSIPRGSDHETSESRSLAISAWWTARRLMKTQQMLC